MMGSGYGRQKVNSRHTARRTGTAGGHSRRTLRPAQASNKRPTVGRPRSETTAAADDVGFSLAVQVRGGSTVVLAAMKAGADLPSLSLPQLTPLPVTVPTHSLNLSKTQFGPKINFFFVCFYFTPGSPL